MMQLMQFNSLIGNMKLREVDMTAIALAIFFPILINKFEFRTEEEMKEMPKSDDSVEVDSESEEDDEDDFTDDGTPTINE